MMRPIRVFTRQALPQDYAAIEAITREAFLNLRHPGCDEHYFIHQIHEANAQVPENDLIALVRGELAGHICCVPAALKTNDGELLDDVLYVAILTVKPDFQLQGVGKRLMLSVIQRARLEGRRALVVEGNPAYYGRFGFRPIKDFGFTLPDGRAFDALMLLPLHAHALDGVSGGTFDYPVPCHFTEAEAEAFDQQFLSQKSSVSGERKSMEQHIAHATPLLWPSAKGDLYPLLAAQLKSLVEGCKLPLPALSNAAALLWDALPEVNWVGFYLAKDTTLYLGPFQGKVACTVIPFGKGVCGTAAATQVTQIVKNVEQFPGHIACDSASKAEIVLPILVNGRIMGVIDIDSPRQARFDEADAEGLSLVMDILVHQVDWTNGLL